MRLWHEALISQLPRPQLLGQHRECCALRGNGWGRKHATVDYVFTHSPYRLYAYHRLIMEEMANRGYKVSPEWLDKNYRGKTCLRKSWTIPSIVSMMQNTMRSAWLISERKALSWSKSQDWLHIITLLVIFSNNKDETFRVFLRSPFYEY